MVISIIAMLAMLLFPVGSKIIGQVNDAKCRNSLRHLGMVIITAATDDDGTYPSIENDPKSDPQTGGQEGFDAVKLGIEPSRS